MNKSCSSLLWAALPLVLVACGGGGGSTPTPTEDANAVPASASQSSAAMVGYLSALGSQTSETRDPLDVSKFDPPKPDDTEPASVP